MCGIAGFWVEPRESQEMLMQRLHAMNQTLVHRGPDDGGIWVDEEVGVGLANRRLAILDLSASGHQPMFSSCGRYVIVYNGEVYNFASVRDALAREGSTFRSHTDTEVILEGCARWGLKKTLESLNGMFAFALWDRQARTLSLVRDRIGIKPLYYARFGTSFLFGSELKALLAHPAFTKEVDRSSLALFLRHSYVPAPYSMYRHVRKLPPGHTLTLTTVDGGLETAPYWSVKGIVEGAARNDISEDEAITELESLLRDAVRLQMVSDVPLGAFLSGGIDSSTVVALMQAQSSRKVKTFSIGFAEKNYDEASHARGVAQHLGTDHEELYVCPKQVYETIPSLAEIYDEPFSDPSQIPTYLLSALTRRKVTVSLSGDGGDELFGGYTHYLQLRKRWEILRHIPHPFRSLAAGAVKALLPDDVESTQRSPLSRLPGFGSNHDMWRKLSSIAGMLDLRSPELLLHRLVSTWKAPLDVVPGAHEPSTAFTDESQWPNTSNSLSRFMYLDLVTYLPDDVLTKVDRASMAVGLEARVPLLDHRVVSFAMQLPNHLKIRNGQGKWLLRQVLERYVPKDLFDRPKMGFSVPIGTWLRGPLRDWAETLLDEKLLVDQGFFRPEPIRQKWVEHIDGRHNWGPLIWDVLMFQSWRTRWL